MKTLYARTQPKQRIERFFRCGIEFGNAWQEVEVDTATAKRLEEEQMLEVTDKRPEDMPNEADGTEGENNAAQSKPATKKAASK